MLALLALLALPLLSGPISADNTAKLEQLRVEIRQLREELDSHQTRKRDLRQQLRTTERHIGKTAALLKGLKRQLTRQQRELTALHKRQQTLSHDLQKQRVALAQQIRAAYAIGQQEYLKILLNQQDPAAVTRTLTYYDYFHRARLARIQDIDAKLADLHTVENRIEQETKKLRENRHEQNQEKARQEQTRSKRRQLLARINQQISSKGQRLTQMLENERRLQQLLDQLAENSTAPPAEITSEQGERRAFSTLRGQLEWPTRGRLSSRFGKPRNVGKLTWQGVSIAAPEGTEVRAISHGRIAYSNWLRGFGLLIIIDHGDGYMSLYGANQSLFKEVGDWVETGDAIASVGNSGGRKDTALYFEIRNRGKPTNPLKWCRGRPKR
ncbi:MAG: peptidoglycan DD-metalloendopeptidase family protein [Gammaproteobacteria bacterium]|nr:peptidoglycan DD-metalloendopeptidase family protein [Gammaproteobacteria bacterium]